MNRLLWHSNAPFAPTGYGQQTALFTPRLAEHYQTAISAFYGLDGAPINWRGVPVLPGLGQGDYGNTALIPHANFHFGGDIKAGLVVTLGDVWVWDPAVISAMNVACWVPVDHVPAPPRVTQFFRESEATPIAMSRFGQRELAEFDPLYVPHGVDADIYKPGDRNEGRSLLGVPEDAFLVGMVAANKGRPSRKGFQEAFEAFRYFREQHEDAHLYLHTIPEANMMAGEDIPALLASLEIPEGCVRIANQYRMLFAPFKQEEMAKIYSAFDVFLNPANGEGFGVPILEAQACFPAGTEIRVEDPLAVQVRPYTGRLVKIETARGSFEATADHPVWTQRGWQSAGSVHPGDQLLFSHAPERLDQVHTGPIERVAGSVQDDALGAGGGHGRHDQGRSVLAATEPGLDAQDVLSAGRTEASADERIRAALLRRIGGWRGHGDNPAHEPRQGAELQLQAVGDRLQHGQTDDGLAGSTYPIGLDRLPGDAARNDQLSRVYGGTRTAPPVSPDPAAAGLEGRLDGGGHRVVRDPSLTITTGPLDDSAARDRLAGPGAEYDTVTAVSERDVRDLPVYNFTTRSGVYEVGAGYLVHNCGVPVVVTDFSAMKEVAGAGWRVPGHPYWTPQNSWQAKADVGEIIGALEKCYAMDESERRALSEGARKHALQYHAPKVVEEHFLPALEEVAVRASQPKLRNEPWLTRHIPTGGRLALDVGANVGEVSEHLLKGFKRVHAFEPNPEAFEQLRAVGDDRLQIREAAVGAKNGKLELKTYAHHSHASAFEDEDLDTITRGEATGTIEVPMVSLDELRYPQKPVDFIKIDTEGYEYEVLQGAKQTLSARKPRLLIEIHAAENGERCRGLLEGLGYELTHIPHPHQGVPPGHYWLAAK